jgi:hypothetical protein
VNRIDIRPLDFFQKLPRIRGKGFHITPLPFGIDGVKGQRRLAGAADASNDD